VHDSRPWNTVGVETTREAGDAAAKALTETFELLETLKALNIAADAAEHPELDEAVLERRFWRRIRKQKDADDTRRGAPPRYRKL
jgi:hypothetical protein